MLTKAAFIESKTVILWNIITISSNYFILSLIYSCDGKSEFSWHQSSVSHDASEIILICWFGTQETFIIIINVDEQEVQKQKIKVLQSLLNMLHTFKKVNLYT